jgi:hypothetical protein
LTSSINLLVGFSLIQWFFGFVPCVLFALLGGAISLLFVPTPPEAMPAPPEALPDDLHQPTRPAEDSPGDV